MSGYNKKQKFFLESLGCPRNLVDSEFFAGLAEQGGYQLTNNPEEATLIIINTCSFIKDAKEESIERILELAEIKKKHHCQLIVTGCLVQRYKEELLNSLPEVDHFVELKDFQKFSGLLSLTDLNMQRSALEPLPYAYLRISDGCDNLCSYCAIPSIRGRVKSEPLDQLIDEARLLADNGIRELIITAMDITQYGKDLTQKTGLIKLLEELSSISGIEWIRLLYLHPAHITNELLYYIKGNSKVCQYLDIPIQHINDKILSQMNRHITRKEIEELIDKIRKILPQAALRTTLITGFPGETEEQLNELVDFIKKTRFNRLGVFQYSRESGTQAFNIPDQIHHQTALRRKRVLTELHNSISEELLKKIVGQTVEVIIDNKSLDDSFLWEGRTRFDAPEIDGMVFITSGKAKIGDIVQVKITDSLVHDLIGFIPDNQVK
ncbi:MAG: 30S ribosomal protein S12 methylthiotransferase RimO [Candidatus Cloacimonetes bacterium]|nr:30S ribosomal protein S12 methylthiotransferase RimO [Candidatus Cloacimonadota bacterium]